MADLKISQLSNAGALTGTEEVEVVQGGANVKTTPAAIAALGGGGGTWGTITGTLSNQTDLNTALGLKAALASPVFTGTPTAPTQSPADNSTKLATTAYVDAASGVVIGVQDFNIPAGAFFPQLTNGCAVLAGTEIATSLILLQTLDFDQTTQEFAQVHFVLPRKWNNGTITAVVYWTAASGSGAVEWGISGGAYSDDDALSTALGTPQVIADTLITANDVHITSATPAITLAGTPADADFLVIRISRNPASGSDTLTADAKLIAVSLRLTTDSGKDA